MPPAPDAPLHVDDVLADLRARLQAAADPGVKAWWERYLKGAIAFRGVGMPTVRAVLDRWWSERLDRSPPERQKELAFEMFRSPWCEDKIAGILSLQRLGSSVGEDDVHRIAVLFREGQIHEWSTTDWLCVKVLDRLVRRGAPYADAIARWAHDASGPVWQRRAGLVAFALVAPSATDDQRHLILAAAGALAPSRERFHQTAVGWTVRELARGAPEEAIAFLRGHRGALSREALRYALERSPEDVRREFLPATRASGRRMGASSAERSGVAASPRTRGGSRGVRSEGTSER